MKTLTTVLIVTLTMLVTAFPAVAAPGISPPNIDNKLNELSNKYNSLEASWGRFQVGGNVSVEADSHLGQTTVNPTFEQKMGLSFDASIDPNHAFSLKLANDGGWGLTPFSNSPTLAPVTTPLQIDEAFLKIQYPHTLDYLGRFRFSFGPLGLVADFFNNPAEGFAIQTSTGTFHVVGLYSRIATNFQANSTQLASTEEYFAGRIGWANQTTIIGLNLVPNGIAAEKAASVDLSTSFYQGKLAAEFGWYAFPSTVADLNTTGSLGALVSFGRNFRTNDYFQLKADYLSTKFRPSCSSINHPADDTREWFIPNTHGLEFYLLNDLSHHFFLENHLIGLTPVTDFDASGTTYRMSSSIIKNFSAVSQLQFGVEAQHSAKQTSRFLFTRWSLQF